MTMTTITESVLEEAALEWHGGPRLAGGAWAGLGNSSLSEGNRSVRR